MIKTMIEVQGENEREFEANLNAAFDRLGFEPKQPGRDAYQRDLYRAMQQNGMDAHKLVIDFRLAEAKRFAEGDIV